MYSSVRAAMSSSRGATRCRHPTNGRAIRRSPAGPLDLMRFAPVEAASSSLPATFQKENTILTDGVSFWSGRRGSNSLPRPWQGRALPDELRPQAAPLLQRLWCLRPGSNRRHADFQSAALPTELPRHMATKKGLEPSTSSVTGWRSNQLNYLAMCAFVLELKLAYYSKYRAECQHPFPVFPAIFSEGGG